MNPQEKIESAREHFVLGLMEFYQGLGLSKEELLERIREDAELARLQNQSGDTTHPESDGVYAEILEKIIT